MTLKKGDKVRLVKQGEPIGWESRDWTKVANLALKKVYKIKRIISSTVIEVKGGKDLSFHPDHFEKV